MVLDGAFASCLGKGREGVIDLDSEEEEEPEAQKEAPPLPPPAEASALELKLAALERPLIELDSEGDEEEGDRTAAPPSPSRSSSSSSSSSSSPSTIGPSCLDSSLEAPWALELPPPLAELPGLLESPPRLAEPLPVPCEPPPPLFEPRPFEPPQQTREPSPQPFELPPRPFELPPRPLEHPPRPFELPPRPEHPPQPFELEPWTVQVQPRPRLLLDPPLRTIEHPPRPFELEAWPVQAQPLPRFSEPAPRLAELVRRPEQQPPAVAQVPALDPFANALARLRIEHMHPWQRALLEAWRAGRDGLVLSGTGSGKSLCFQVPALMDGGGVVIVVSPLISLMRDQVANLAQRGVTSCFLGSAQPDRSLEDRALDGEFALVYVCPETVDRVRGRLRALYMQGRIRLFAIDEAHCISRWGHDFRHAYLQLGSLRRHFPSVPIMALTATATSRVREEIASSLGLREPHVCVNSFYRTNLAYSVRHSTCRQSCWERDLGSFYPLRGRRAVAGSGAGPEEEPCTIVYAPSRRETEGIASWLVERGVAAAPYHAKLPRSHLDDVHMRFLQGTLVCIVATIAFGMGINKANVRRVIHYGYPQSLEALHQETGRAGRDGRPSQCVLFANLDVPPRLLPSKRDRETKRICLAMLKSVYKYAISETGCRVRTLLQYFDEAKGPTWRCGSCDLCAAAATEAAAADLSPDCFRLLDAIQQVERLRVALARGLAHFSCVEQALLGKAAPQKGEIDGIGLESLPCFGTGADRPAKFWRGLAQMLSEAGLVEGSGAKKARPASKLDQAPASATSSTDFLQNPQLTELGRVACASLERGERVPLVSSLVPSPAVAAVLEGQLAKAARAAGRGRGVAAGRGSGGRRSGRGRRASVGDGEDGDGDGGDDWGPGRRLGGRRKRGRKRFSRKGGKGSKGAGGQWAARGGKRGAGPRAFGSSKLQKWAGQAGACSFRSSAGGFGALPGKQRKLCAAGA